MNTFKYSSPSTQPSSITLDTLVQEASQKTSHPYLKRKVTHRKTFAKLQNQDSLLRWTKDQLRSESLSLYTNSHPRLHVSSRNTDGTTTGKAACFDRAELFDFFDLQSQKAITQMGRTRTTSVSPQRTSSSSDMYGISMKQGSTQTLIDSGMVPTEDAPFASIASKYPTYSLSLKGVSVLIYSHIVPKV